MAHLRVIRTTFGRVFGQRSDIGHAWTGVCKTPSNVRTVNVSGHCSQYSAQHPEFLDAVVRVLHPMIALRCEPRRNGKITVRWFDGGLMVSAPARLLAPSLPSEPHVHTGNVMVGGAT